MKELSQDDRSEVGKVYTIIFKLKVMKKNISFKGVGSAGFVLIACFILALAIFHYVLGNPANFMNNDPNNQPIPGNLMGTIYKGGMIVPVIQTLLLTVLVLSVERFFAIRKARGRGNLSQFIRKVKERTESAGGSYYDYPGDFDGIVGYRNRDDQVVRSFGQCRCSRLDRFVYRYIRGVGQYGFRYYDRGAGCDLL